MNSKLSIHDDEHHRAARRLMVERSIAGRGISDPRVLAAMLDVPRHRFVPAELAAEAEADRPLGIGFGATISQPYIVALMTELARPRPESSVLEIGTGSGYQAAILARLARRVVSLEREPELARRARQRLAELGLANVEVAVGDGSLGFPAAAPFDSILVTAAGPRLPPALLAQLSEGGRLVMPVGGHDHQRLLVAERRGESSTIEDHGAVIFVPLVGEQGY